MTRETHGAYRACAAYLALALLAGPAVAQNAPSIERVRVGLPAGRGGQTEGRSRAGAWTPVAVTLKAGAKGATLGEYRVRVETADAEELNCSYTAEVPAMAGGAERTIHAYAVPGPDNAPFNVRLETADGRLVARQGNILRDQGNMLTEHDILFLTLGAGLAQMKRAAEKADQPEKGDAGQPQEQGRRQFAFIEDVSAMPDHWFGYAAVDAAVLATSNRDFVLQLTQEPAKCRALREWVLRGGQVVVSVGKNRQEASRLLAGDDKTPAVLPLVPMQFTGTEVLRTLPNLSTQWSSQAAHKAALQDLDITTIVPGPGVVSMVRDGGKPVILQGACGLGRVIVVAFDLDAPKFATWEGQEAFWQRLQKEIAPHIQPRKGAAPGGGKGPRPVPGDFDPEGDRRTELKAQLRKELETFEAVTPISFAVVAFFILFYIVLVGPLDYFVLKKVFKKLELTWITFPLTVIVVSVVAYFAAYSIKGDDLRVNKVDVIDVDMHGGGQVYGRTWLTLFSPRVQAYTLGLAPAGGAWSGAPAADAPPPTLALLGVNETQRGGTQGLFPRPYEFAADGAGLVKVPVPVWATRSVEASWRAPLPKTPPLGITDALGLPRASKGGKGLSGKLTNNLETPLLGCVLFYKERWYDLGKLEPGESKQLDPLFAADAQGQNRDVPSWFGDEILKPGDPLGRAGERINANFRLGRGRETYLAVKKAMFFQASGRTTETNAGLRTLDQSWRLRALTEHPAGDRPRWRDEAILVARTPMLSDEANWVSEHAATPSRLWVGKLPEAGAEPPRLSGSITQETFVRFFIPVQ